MLGLISAAFFSFSALPLCFLFPVSSPPQALAELASIDLPQKNSAEMLHGPAPWPPQLQVTGPSDSRGWRTRHSSSAPFSASAAEHIVAAASAQCRAAPTGKKNRKSNKPPRPDEIINTRTQTARSCFGARHNSRRPNQPRRRDETPDGLQASEVITVSSFLDRANKQQNPNALSFQPRPLNKRPPLSSTLGRPSVSPSGTRGEARRETGNM